MPELDQAAFWAALWLMPTKDLQELHDNLRPPTSERDQARLRRQLVLAVPQIPRLVRIFRGQDPDTLTKDDNNAPKTYNAGDKQNRREADLLWVYGPNDNTAIDTVTNMICLSPQLHDWWSRGYFALEPIRFWSEPLPDSTPDKPDRPDRAAKKRKIPEKWSIQIRFHWLRKTDVPMLTSKVKFSDDPITMMQEPAGEGLVRAFNATTCRQVENGQIFTMTADSRDRLPDYDILLLQWDLLRMWRLAGGADPTVYPLDDDFLDSSDEEVQVTGDDGIQETARGDGQKDVHRDSTTR
ncbi:tat pathway signal sequence [Colletotrichum higginsianum]|nr:tat pathway signal sequence [Colletotrichum higginsianum]